MKKKWCVGILSGMLGVMAITAMPVNAETPQTKPVDVTYAKKSEYTLSIPSAMELTADDAGKTETVGLSMVNTEPGKVVQIKLTGIDASNNVTLTRESDSASKVVSTVKDSNNQNIANNSVIAEFEGNESNPAAITGVVIKFSAIKDSGNAALVKAGKYKGTITFVASVEDK